MYIMLRLAVDSNELLTSPSTQKSIYKSIRGEVSCIGYELRENMALEKWTKAERNSIETAIMTYTKIDEEAHQVGIHERLKER